jgi:hypothetical protein
MSFAGEDIKQFVLARGDVLSSIPQGCIKLGHSLLFRRYRIRAVILLLWDTAAIRYGTIVEFSYHRIFKLITTLDLATCLVLLAIAGVYSSYG